MSRYLAALAKIQPRGPDHVVYKLEKKIFAAQTVLAITGDPGWYAQPRRDFLSYNGEIYNYKNFGNYSTDTELVHETVVSKSQHRWKLFQGPWAWAWTDFDSLAYACDPQGERCLYHYQDNDILIVSSEVSAILTLVQCEQHIPPYSNKGWTMISQTPWQGVTRCEPGQLYQDGIVIGKLDSLFDWITDTGPNSIQDALDEFESVWTQGCAVMTPAEPATLSYSGGIDSTLIARHIKDLELLAIDIIGKDPIVDQLTCRKIAVDFESWAKYYRHIIELTRMPAQSWSHVGKWLVAKHANNRIIFTGLAADELFGGYDVYQKLQYTVEHSTSPYSHWDHDNLWPTCLEVYQGDPKQATLLMDYWYQVVGVDAPGLDRLGGACGKETRNPFMLKSVIQFALNLPWHLKVSNPAKPVLRRFLQGSYQGKIDTKRGFAGHANDSLPWLGVVVTCNGDRHRDWQNIAQTTFIEYTNG